MLRTKMPTLPGKLAAIFVNLSRRTALPWRADSSRTAGGTKITLTRRDNAAMHTRLPSLGLELQTNSDLPSASRENLQDLREVRSTCCRSCNERQSIDCR